MKNAICSFLAALALQAQVATGGDIDCRTRYVQAVGACAQLSNLFDPGLRAGAQIACVDGARITRSYCMSETDACLDYRQVAFDNSAAGCEATFDPTVCAAAAACEDTILQQRANCISVAAGVLASGTAACPR